MHLNLEYVVYTGKLFLASCCRQTY